MDTAQPALPILREDEGMLLWRANRVRDAHIPRPTHVNSVSKPCYILGFLLGVTISNGSGCSCATEHFVQPCGDDLVVVRSECNWPDVERVSATGRVCLRTFGGKLLVSLRWFQRCCDKFHLTESRQSHVTYLDRRFPVEQAIMNLRRCQGNNLLLPCDVQDWEGTATNGLSH